MSEQREPTPEEAEAFLEEQEAKGLVRWTGEYQIGRAGKPIKVYAITDKGRAASKRWVVRDRRHRGRHQ